MKVRGLLFAKGYTGLRLAAELGCNPGTVSQVISGVSVSRRIRGRIAEIIGYWPWPEHPRRTNGLTPEHRASVAARRSARRSAVGA